MKQIIFAAAFAATLASIATPGLTEDMHHHVSETEGLRAIHAWTRATSGNEALVFLEIENTSSETTTLSGAETDIAASVEITGFQMIDGKPVYVPLPAMPIQPGKELHFEPEALALRLNGLKVPLNEGGEFGLELEFGHRHLEIHVEIENAHATGHSHAGHTH
jgi:periplasmic copper chaperone A